jgi:hypothetical protein
LPPPSTPATTETTTLAAALLPQSGVAAAPQADPAPTPTPLQAAIAAFLDNFQDNGPLIATLAALAAASGSQALEDAVAGLASGGPVGAIIALLQHLPPPSTPATTETTTLAARTEGGTPIGSVARVFGHDATTSAGRPIVGLFTPRQASEPQESGAAIEANADASEKPRFKVPKATQVLDQTDEGTKGADEGNGLVRKSLQFKPDVVLPVGSESGAGGGFRPLQGLKDAVDRVTGRADDAKGPAGAGNHDTGK